LVHIPIPLKSNGIYSFIPSSKNESIPGIVPKQHCSDCDSSVLFKKG